MIQIERLGEPAVLASKKAKWTATYLEQRRVKPGRHPESSQYAHEDIVAALRAMSFGKCFYCEQPLGDGEQQVDHYVGTAEEPSRAFEWSNLYLACSACNRKLSSVPHTECLDPCDPSTRPDAHLTFDNHRIQAREASARGLRTIQRYRLGRSDLDYRRLLQLHRFVEVQIAVLTRMNAEQRRDMTDAEKDLLRRFRQPDYPFSLMFSTYLAKLGL